MTYKYPLDVAGQMGASGLRCPDIIENPLRKELPSKIWLNGENEYEFEYIGGPRKCIFLGEHGGEAFRPAGGYVDFPINEQAEELHRKNGLLTRRELYLGFDRGSPEGDKTVIHMTNAGGSDEIYNRFREDARDAIAYAFHIPKEHLFPEGENRFVYDKRKGESLAAGVYDSSAWTGRHPRPKSETPAPETLAEARENLVKAWEDLFEASGLLDWIRSWFAVERFYKRDGTVIEKQTIILAVRRRHREAIKLSIRKKNGVRAVQNAFRQMGLTFRRAAKEISSLSELLTETSRRLNK